MKVLFAGGGTGGHFNPLIAVAEALVQISDEQKMVDVHMYFFSDAPYDEALLRQYRIEYRYVPAGKLRLYFSLKVIPDTIKTFFGICKAILEVFSVYPDVVFSKGGYCAFPVVTAARLFRIPVVIHDSDSVPGRVSIYSGKFAEKIALVYPDAAKYFKSDKIAITGLPIRQSVLYPQKNGAYEYLRLDSTIPTLLVLGGSQGAEAINNALLDAVPELVKTYQIIHQVGDANVDALTKDAHARLNGNQNENRYKIFGTLNPLALSMAAGVSFLVITRAGSTLCEIAAWGLPAIIVPIPQAISRDQVSNAFHYARTGAAIVIEQENMSPHILQNEIDRLFHHSDVHERMVRAAKGFARIDAAQVIARELLIIAKEHEMGV